MLTGMALDRAISRYNYIASPETVLTTNPSFGCLVQVLTSYIFFMESLSVDSKQDGDNALIRFVRPRHCNQVPRSRRL